MSLALAVLLASELPDAHAFAPSSLRAFGTAKASLPSRSCDARAGLTSVKMAVAVWKEVKDPSSGGTYYWNTQTGETSWDKPKAPMPAARGAAAGPAGASLATYNGSGKYLNKEAIAALPKQQQSSLMPGYNVFGDGMFFGEGMLKGEMLESWANDQQYDNWGTPLPTASEATKAAYAAGKTAAKMKELENTSTYPYDDDIVIPK